MNRQVTDKFWYKQVLFLLLTQTGGMLESVGVKEKKEQEDYAFVLFT